MTIKIETRNRISQMKSESFWSTLDEEKEIV